MKIKETVVGGLNDFRGGLGEFREFILKGNAFDLAVGVIIGAAFSSIVTSLVGDILLPPIGYITGGIDFSSHFLDLNVLLRGEPAQASVEAARNAGHAVIAYGRFLNALINLLIVGFVIFMVVKQITRFRRFYEFGKPEEKTPEHVRLLTEIRDILASKPTV